MRRAAAGGGHDAHTAGTNHVQRHRDPRDRRCDQRQCDGGEQRGERCERLRDLVSERSNSTDRLELELCFGTGRA